MLFIDGMTEEERKQDKLDKISQFLKSTSEDIKKDLFTSDTYLDENS